MAHDQLAGVSESGGTVGFCRLPVIRIASTCAHTPVLPRLSESVQVERHETSAMVQFSESFKAGAPKAR